MVKDVPKNRVSKAIGIFLALIQLAASVVFMLSLIKIDMLPKEHLIMIGAGLAVLFLIMFLSQALSKNKAILGKLISILLSIALIMGAFYLHEMHKTMEEMVQQEEQLEAEKKEEIKKQVVVAVVAHDPAETVEDAKFYNFGTQAVIKDYEVESVVDDINKKLNYYIWTTDCGSMVEQVNALFNRDVQAIVYNTVYEEVMFEHIENYKEKIKYIYTHELVDDTNIIEKSHTSVTKEPFAVYISGIDVYGKIDQKSRSDVNIIAVVNPITHQVLLVTTPRDYYVPIPGVSYGQRDKLTHAGLYGIDASMRTLEELYDVELDYYFRVNFTSIKKMVDALGGIDVYSKEAFTTVSNNGVVIKKGMNHLNGAQALAFARERKHVASGDNQRGKNQQEVIKAMLKKILSPAVLRNMNGLFDSVRGNIQMSMTMKQIRDLFKTQIKTGAEWSLATMAAEGSGSKETCFSMSGTAVYVAWPVQSSIEPIKQAIDDVLDGKILEEAKPIKVD